MNCAYCEDSRLEITHTYIAHQSKTQTGRCPKCERKYTIISIILGEVGKVDGAYAIAGALRRGEGPVLTERSASEPRPDLK